MSKFHCENDPLSAQKIFDLIEHLVSRRSWSLAVRHSLPPEQYAGVLSDECDVRKNPWS